jgi:hypothetical protein
MDDVVMAFIAHVFTGGGPRHLLWSLALPNWPNQQCDVDIRRHHALYDRYE